MRALRPLLCVLVAACSTPPPASRGYFPGTIGPEGGVLEGRPDSELAGLAVEVPAGALASPLLIDARLLAEEPTLGPTGVAVGPTFLLLPEGQALSAPARVTVPIATSRLDDFEQAPGDCRVWLREGTTWTQTPQRSSTAQSVTVETAALGAAAAGALIKEPARSFPPLPPCTDASGFCVTALNDRLKETSGQFSSISADGKMLALRSSSTATGLQGAVTEYDVATGTNLRASPDFVIPTSTQPRPALSALAQRVALAPDGAAWVALPTGVAQVPFTGAALFSSDAPDTRTAALLFTADGRRHRLRISGNKAGTVPAVLSLSSASAAAEPAPVELERAAAPFAVEQLPVVTAGAALTYAFWTTGVRSLAELKAPPVKGTAVATPAELTDATLKLTPYDELAVSPDGDTYALSLAKEDSKGRSLFIQSRSGAVSLALAGLGNLAALEFGGDGALYAASASTAQLYRVELPGGAVRSIPLTAAAFGSAEYKARLPLALRRFTFPATAISPARHALFVITQAAQREVLRVERSTGGGGRPDGGMGDAGTGDAGQRDGGTTDAGFCGDGTVGPTEQCEPPSANAACTYGLTSCTVCSSSCQSAPGLATFCGDGVVQAAAELCDTVPPGARCADRGLVRGEPGCPTCQATEYSGCFQARVRAAAITKGVVCAIGEADGVVRCVGADAPVAALDGGSMRALAVGPSLSGPAHVCALRSSDGTPVCAGAGPAAQPLVSASYVEVASTRETTCAVRLGGTVDCWGAALTNGPGLPSPARGLASSRDTFCALDGAGAIGCSSSVSGTPPSPPAGAFSAVAVGGSFVVGLTLDGGALAITSGSGLLQALPTNSPYVRVAAADSHACAERADGGVDCWGFPINGQTLVPRTTGFLATAGGSDTCLIDDGALDCFGAEHPLEAFPFAARSDLRRAPAQRAGPFASLLRGDFDVCALPSAGAPSCRGGLFGLEDFGGPNAFKGVFTGLGAGFTRRLCGLDTQGLLHCTTNGERVPAEGPFRFVDPALRFAVDSAGTLRFLTPPAAAIASPPAESFSAVAASAVHACGLRAADGAVVCWGQNFSGQTTAPAGAFTQLALPSTSTSCALDAAGAVTCWGAAATTTAPAGTFKELIAEPTRLCGLTLAGALTCRAFGTSSDVTEAGPFLWARGDCRIRSTGALQCPPSASRPTGSPVLLSETPGGAFVQAAFDSQTAVALRTDGGLAFWGAGASPTVAVKQGTFASAFGCVIPTDGSLRCFGSQLNQTVAPPTAGTFTQVELGGSVGCALGTDGKARCFGDGASPVLTQAPAAEVFSRLALTDRHACGLRPDGTVRCWGAAVFAETTAPAGTFSDVAVKGLRSCAIDAAGALTCWGLPAGTTSLPPGPYRALRSTNFGRGMCGLLRDGGAVCEPTNLAQPKGPVVDVQAGDNQVCALGSDGGVSCVRGREELFGL